MNKIMLYVGLAILLGTVTMVAPLAVLGPSDSTPVGEYTIKMDNQDKAYEDGGTLEGGNFSTETWTRPEPAPEASKSLAVPNSQQETELTVKTAENPSDLSPIGLMTVPSFLVALGVFVYLRKRMS